ncbi:MAG: hypothetical protein JNL08_09590 [Planctomycetes bacterium]|nr:hypothetical protein [Planctomycetota bacterium]
MTEKDETFWREVLATRRAAEALEAEQMAAAEAELAEESAAPPLAPERVEAMVAAAQRHRLALPAAVPVAAPPRRRWQGLLRIAAAALLLVLAQPWLAAASSSVFEAFAELRLQRTHETQTLQEVLRITAEPRQAEASRKAAQGEVYSLVHWAIQTLRRVEGEPGPVQGSARAGVERLRACVAKPPKFTGRTLLGEFRPLVRQVEDTHLPVDVRAEAIERVVRLVEQGLAVLWGVAEEPESGRNASLLRQNGSMRRVIASLLE